MEKATYYETAAKWWVDTLKNAHSLDNHNMGDQSETGAMAMILGTLLAESAIPSDENIAKFGKKLGNEIKKIVEENGVLSLVCDYGPDYFLSQIANETDIDERAFPWKTYMEITECEVKVSKGYGSSTKVIFSNK